MAWVASRLVACHREGMPLHRLAVTSPVMDRYQRALSGILKELRGRPWARQARLTISPRGRASPHTPFHRGLLPLTFLALGERREDLAALLLSPHYQALKSRQAALALWDRRFREKGAAQGWEHLKRVAAREAWGDPALEKIIGTLDHLWARTSLPRPPAEPGPHGWRRRSSSWGSPGTGRGEESQFERLTTLMGDFTLALGDEVFPAGGALAWLHQGIKNERPAGPRVQEAGVQVLGWLETRGLDFDRIFCLGMNSGAFPGAPRPLPLLSRAERERVLGGTQESQDQFAREQFDSLLGVAPHLTLTRPAQEDQEPQVGTPFFPGTGRQTAWRS